MLMRNLNQPAGLRNGTQLIITRLRDWHVQAKIMSSSNVGDIVFIPRIIMTPNKSRCSFKMKRRQFPISVCFAMTININKSQDQSLEKIGLFLPK